MILTEAQIVEQYVRALDDASRVLASRPWAGGDPPSIAGLNGWVFENVVRECLLMELRAMGYAPRPLEQVRLVGRARIDLVIGDAAIELKARGSFGPGDAKYSSYRDAVERSGRRYLYLTLQESHAPFRAVTEDVFGAGRSFFLDTPGDWKRFVECVAAGLAR